MTQATVPLSNHVQATEGQQAVAVADCNGDGINDIAAIDFSDSGANMIGVVQGLGNRSFASDQIVYSTLRPIDDPIPALSYRD
jgi:hypothetical protein